MGHFGKPLLRQGENRLRNAHLYFLEKEKTESPNMLITQNYRPYLPRGTSGNNAYICWYLYDWADIFCSTSVIVVSGIGCQYRAIASSWTVALAGVIRVL